jgi:predicted RNA-binding protein with PUA-like domain
MKSEPAEVSIDDVLAMPRCQVAWFGVRNYQARNFMRDVMRPGDPVFFYHSSCPQPGIAGIAEVASAPYVDATQFQPGKYHDPKSTPESPRWFNVDVRVVQKTRLVSLPELRAHPELAGMVLLRPGNRLSITPVTEGEWIFITECLLGRRPATAARRVPASAPPPRARRRDERERPE